MIGAKNIMVGSKYIYLIAPNKASQPTPKIGAAELYRYVQ